MEKIGIDTSQNVLIDYELASLGDRIYAQLLDWVFMFSFIIGISIILGIGGIKEQWVMLLFYLPVFFYSFISELVFQGQSLGKIILQIKVTKLDGTQASIGNYFLRWIFRIVDIWFGYSAIAITTIIVNGRCQRLGDIVAGTTIVKLRKKAGLTNTIHVQLPDDYQLSFPEVTRLTEEDISIIREVLQTDRENNDDNADFLIYETIAVLEKKLGIKNKLKTREFLFTLMKDFNFINKPDMSVFTKNRFDNGIDFELTDTKDLQASNL